MTEETGRCPLAEPSEVSEFLKVPEGTLQQWRRAGKGPRSHRVGRHVRYAWPDVERWLAGQASPSGPAGTGAVLAAK